MSEWHEKYRERYARLKAAGKSFFPHAVFKDTLVAFLLLAALSWLAWEKGALLEELADPTDTSYNPRPEWYFLFMFQALKFFPGHLEALGAVVLPGIGLAFLFLLPLIDRGPERHPLDRPLWTGLGVCSLAGFAWLTWAGYTSPMTNPVMDRDPVAAEGLRLYRGLNCSYCHTIAGRGGKFGPRLDDVMRKRNEEWVVKHFRDPQATSPGSTMPKLNLLDDEVNALVAYLKSLGPGPFSKEAPSLFAENCAACHKIGKEGGDSAPDLSLIGSAREKTYIRRYIEDPSVANPSSTMPGYKGQLTEEQIEDLSRYLSSLR